LKPTCVRPVKAIRLRFFRKTSRWTRIVGQKPKIRLAFFPPTLARTPQSLSLNAMKPPGTIRIFIFGSLAAQGRHEEAMPCYRAAIRAKPDFVEACFNYLIALAKQHRYTEAARQFQEMLQRQSDHAATKAALERALKLAKGQQPRPAN
jgi:tetratricopeptide (TPR) repeat protein